MPSYKGAAIVVDFGTATNFDIVAEDGAFDGSVIAPGANLSIEALHQAAALLPRVAIHRAQKVIGRDTISSMQSGVYWGYVGLITGLINGIKKEYGKPMTVVATGGLAHLFRPDIPAIEHIDPDLTMRGLMLIHARNKKDNGSFRTARRTRFPAAGRVGRDRHEFQRLWLRPARRPAVDHRRLRRVVRTRRQHAWRGPDHARHPLSGRAAGECAGHHCHPCP